MSLTNFCELILSGFCDPMTHNNLKSFFIWEFKKAKRDHFYDSRSFFEGCLTESNKLLNKIEEKYYDKKADLETIVRLRKGKNILEDCKEIEKEIEELGINNCSINVSDYITHYSGFLFGNDIIRIKKSIYSAYFELSVSECLELAVNESKEYLPNEILQELEYKLKNEVDEEDSKINFMQTDQNEVLDESYRYKMSITITKIASAEDVERHPGCEVGKKFSFIKPVETKDEVIERMKKYTAIPHFEDLKGDFKKKFGEGNERTIKDVLKKLQAEIEKADSISTEVTFANYPIARNTDKNMVLFYEYSRLKNGYYDDVKEYRSGYYDEKQKSEILPHQVEEFYTPIYSALAYAKYFLYKEWLEDRLNNDLHNYESLSRILKSAKTTVSPEVLKSIIEKGELPQKTHKVLWGGTGNQAHDFKDSFWNDAKVFNQCFYLKKNNVDRKLLPRDRDKNGMKSDIYSKLQELKKKSDTYKS